MASIARRTRTWLSISNLAQLIANRTLYLLVTDVLSREGNGALHSEQRQHLEKV